jgi:hypothetical protein
MNFAAANTIPVTNASVQEYSKTWRTNLVTVRSPFTTQGPPSSAARLTPLLKLGGKVAARCPNLSSGIPVGLVCKRALYQMLNASNVTRVMPPNSTASVTESYSSQYRYGCMMPPTATPFFLGKRAPGCFFHLCPGALPATAIVGEGTGRPLKNRTLAGQTLFRSSQ